VVDNAYVRVCDTRLRRLLETRANDGHADEEFCQLRKPESDDQTSRQRARSAVLLALIGSEQPRDSMAASSAAIRHADEPENKTTTT